MIAHIDFVITDVDNDRAGQITLKYNDGVWAQREVIEEALSVMIHHLATTATDTEIKPWAVSFDDTESEPE